jgi:hypothetical protein
MPITDPIDVDVCVDATRASKKYRERLLAERDPAARARLDSEERKEAQTNAGAVAMQSAAANANSSAASVVEHTPVADSNQNLLDSRETKFFRQVAIYLAHLTHLTGRRKHGRRELPYNT